MASAVAAFVRRVRAWFARERLDRELQEELARHLDARTASLVDDGVAPADARRRAAVSIGNISKLVEETRDARGFPRLASLARDGRYALRQLGRNPLFTSATVATLGLTIGATTALFAIANTVVFRPLPFRQANRLVAMTVAVNGRDLSIMDEDTVRLAIANGTTTFDSFAAVDSRGANLSGGHQPERVRGASVSQQFFAVLRTEPALGRVFTADEATADTPAVIVLGHGLWERAFGSANDVVGRTVRLDDRTYTIVGVMPRGLDYPNRAEFWLPWKPRGIGTGAMYFINGIGRLRDGVTAVAARDDLHALRRAHDSEMSRRARESTIRVESLQEHLYGSFRAPLLLLLSTVALVLLMACANIANLLLARTSARAREMVLRVALGASRGRLVRQLLIENVLLAAIGALPGVVVATIALRAFKAFGPAALAAVPGIAIDGRVLGFTIALTVGTGLLFGIAPALAAAGADPRRWLYERSPEGGRSRPRHLLVLLEVATAVMLTIGAGLVAKSFIRYQATHRGFDPTRVLTASIPLTSAGYAKGPARRAFSDHVLQTVRGSLMVESASHSWTMLDGLIMTVPMPARLTATGRESDEDTFSVAYVGGSYFETFGIPILTGVPCPETTTEQVAVVSASMAKRLFAGQPGLGERITLSGDGSFRVIGMAADVLKLETNTRGLPQVYACTTVNDAPRYGTLAIRVRDGVDPLSVVPLMREAVAAADTNQPISNIKTVSQLVGDAATTRWFSGALIAASAGLSFVLAVFGLYALIAYLVSQRTHEIGVRIALGATPSNIVTLVVRQSAWLCAVGVALGVAGALPLVSVLQTMLFDVDVHDTSVFLGAPALVTVVAILATLVPTLRALNVDPIVTLRTE
jgi:putative ABC transport system permease protein